MPARTRNSDGTMVRDNRAGNASEADDDGDDLRSENDRLSKLLRQRDGTIFQLNKEIKQLKARLDSDEVAKKDAAIARLTSENAKLKGDLALAKMFSP